MLKSLIDKNEKNIIGLMSGTSVDGIDAALVHIIGAGFDTQISLTAFETYPFSKSERAAILDFASNSVVSLDDLARLNFYLGKKFAQVAEHVTLKAGLSLADIDLIGSHGQTVRHLPQSSPFLDDAIACTLQIGDPSVIAKITGVPTVGDFRPADMAVGGQGAPLVPFFDFLFSDHRKRTV
jgi:anhydro-N-acetylmuramic acid kinase